MDVDIGGAEDKSLRTEVDGSLFFFSHPAIAVPAVEATATAEDVAFDGTLIHINMCLAILGDKRLAGFLALHGTTSDWTDLTASI